MKSISFRNARGLYYVLGNNMFLKEDYIYNPLMMVKVVRHEAWHASQDCMALGHLIILTLL